MPHSSSATETPIHIVIPSERRIKTSRLNACPLSAKGETSAHDAGIHPRHASMARKAHGPLASVQLRYKILGPNRNELAASLEDPAERASIHHFNPERFSPYTAQATGWSATIGITTSRDNKGMDAWM